MERSEAVAGEADENVELQILATLTAIRENVHRVRGVEGC
jgi:hypothetical protein